MRTLEDIKKEADLYWIIDKIEHDPYEKVHLEGADFPIKGLTSPEDLVVINEFKCQLKKGKILNVTSPIDNLVPCAEFIKDFLALFFKGIGINPHKSFTFAYIVHYDSAYRYRLQDLANEANEVNLVYRPIKEVKRLLKLSLERDNPSVTIKLKKYYRLLPYLLLIPRIRKSFINAVKKVGIEGMRMDEGDKYWTYQRTDYDFGGIKYWDRIRLLKDMGYKLSEGKR